MSNKRREGFFGEEIAVNYLKSLNYQIIRRNYYTPYGEIDIIAKERECYIFVEVKLRRSKAYGHPLEQLPQKKRERLIQSAQLYLEENKITKCDWRFDYITLLLSGETYKVTHLKNAIEQN